MKDSEFYGKGIPVSLSLKPSLEAEHIRPTIPQNKKRLFRVTIMAAIVAIVASVVARLLVYLINFFTNISFYGKLSLNYFSPANNHLGLWIIAVPAFGGIIVGLMAFYGSKAIRGHGIPEAMEQILINHSKIKPSVSFLKPLSAAVSIGTGGPFGAEGPIIATGGALGSTLGQLLNVTSNERKILLAAGSTAGMSAIFGSPIAGIFLAIELLLFEFSYRSFIPVSIACITGAIFHYLLFGTDPVFRMNISIQPLNAGEIINYGILGLLIGFLSVLVTKAVYFLEDHFEKIHIHWIWWPAIGGLFVGVIGYFSPRTLGVGYENITDILSGSITIRILLSLALLKFISWAIALSSGTSGGTLAPLLTIGGATGALLAYGIHVLIPQADLNLKLAALVGMSAMFAGASRALLTSVIFAVETTGLTGALLPLLAGCSASYLVSIFMMDNSIMTEKIARRGVKTPHVYEPDILEKIKVADVISRDIETVNIETTISEARELLKNANSGSPDYFAAVTLENEYRGILRKVDLNNWKHNGEEFINTLLVKPDMFILSDQSLLAAIEIMAGSKSEALPVISPDGKSELFGILTYRDILSAYSHRFSEHVKDKRVFSIRRQGLKLLVHGKKIFLSRKSRNP